MNQEFPKPPFWARILIFFENLLERARIAFEGSLEFLEWLLIPAFGLLMRPFRWVMQSRVVELTERAQGALEQQSSSLWVRFRDTLATWLPKIFPRRIFGPFYWVAENSVWLLDFALAWIYTRDYRKLIRSLPALLFSIPLLVALLLGRAYSTTQKVTHYNQARREALQNKDQERADFLLARLRQLGFRHEEQADFERAIALMDRDDKDEAITILHDLAPADEPNFAPAHLYMAAALIDGVIPSEDPWPLVQTHAEHVLFLEPEQKLAQRFLAECLLQAGQIEDAMRSMEALRKTFPDLNAELAHYYARKGDLPVAKKFAKGAVKYWADLLATQSSDAASPETADALRITPQGYVRFAESFGILGEREQELSLLRQGAMTYPDSPFNQQAYGAQLEMELPHITLDDPARREQLKDLLIVNHEHTQALQRLFQPMKQGDSMAISVAQELLDDARSSAKLCKSVGDMFLSIEQMPAATRAYQLACQRDAKSAYAWNNLAWIFSHVEPVDLERALQCTDKAMEAKNDANFFETRGQILVKLQRWEEAARYLERALNGTIPNPQDAHRSLATIYTALGRTEQAAAHHAASGQ